MEVVERLAMYKFPQLSRKELEAMLGVADIKQTCVYQEALQEGREEGREEGRQEGALNKAQAIALNMLRQGMAVEQISLLTGLSAEEIQALAG